MATAFTQENLDKLEEAIVQGARRVKYADKEVEYRSLDEMTQIRDLMRKKLGITLRASRSYPEFSKGLETSDDEG